MGGGMRVAIDGLLLWGRFSGVERAIASLAAALPAADPASEYVLYVPQDCPVKGFEAVGLRVRQAPFPGHRKLVRILWQQGVLPRAARRDGADVLLAPGYVLPLRWRGPSVLVVYDVIALTHPELARRANVWHYRVMLPRSAKRATRIAVPSRHVGEQVARWCGVPPEKLAVVPLGVDARFQRVLDPHELARVRARYGLPERFVLYVGNLEPKKNLPRLLEAFALAKRRGIPHRLVLAGAPAWGWAEAQAALARSGVAEEVTLTGYVDEADLPALYTLADLFVFPSLVEGFGLPPLEAMACGTPAVVADVPPFDETAGDAALRVDPCHPEAIADGICAGLADAALCRQLQEAGRARAGRFTWESAARQLAGLLREAEPMETGSRSEA